MSSCSSSCFLVARVRASSFFDFHSPTVFPSGSCIQANVPVGISNRSATNALGAERFRLLQNTPHVVTSHVKNRVMMPQPSAVGCAPVMPAGLRCDHRPQVRRWVPSKKICKIPEFFCPCIQPRNAPRAFRLYPPHVEKLLLAAVAAPCSARLSIKARRNSGIFYIEHFLKTCSGPLQNSHVL